MTTATEAAAIQAIYLMSGAESFLNLMRDNGKVHDGFGHTWFTEVMAHRGVIVAERLVQLDKDLERDFPGVFEYEVTEPLGVWQAQNLEADKATQYLPLVDGELDFRVGDAAFKAELEKRIETWVTEARDYAAKLAAT